MGDKSKALAPEHVEFIQQQHLFFVGTAGAEGTVNVSPKGLDTLRVVNPRQVVWLNLTGSGNETSAHVQENGRMTLMFCSFTEQPLILRLYGQATVVHAGEKWRELSALFDEYVSARQFFELNVELVQASCGYAVPFLEYSGERETLTDWVNDQDQDSIRAFWQEHNQTSLDGKPTSILQYARVGKQ